MLKKVNVPIKQLCSFGNSGHVKSLFIIEKIEELQQLIKEKTSFFILGKGSNTVINPNHHYTHIIKLSPHLFPPHIEGNICWLGAGYSITESLKFLLKHKLSGLEFAIGIPASIGGMLYMNFSCWNQTISDYLEKVQCMTPEGNILTINKKDLAFNYRKSSFQTNKYIILKAGFKLKNSPIEEIKKKSHAYLQKRKTEHPLNEKTFGSIFKNPKNHSTGKLLENLKLNSQPFNKVRLSKKHANFMINHNNASFENIKNYLEFIEKTVKEKIGLSLEREVILIS
ncbi:MAG: UDP-N-acetylmuramate dehydrogenase [bacterium]